MKDRILVIQGDTSPANTLRRRLTARGFAVAVAADVQQALNKHATFDPDLFVLGATVPIARERWAWISSPKMSRWTK